MAKYYQDFVGLNTFVYIPNGYYLPGTSISAADISSRPESKTAGGLFYMQQNTIGGYSLEGGEVIFPLVEDSNAGEFIKNFLFPFDLPNTASFYNAMHVYHNGPYGYPVWRQVRASHNPLSRKQRKENIFTFVSEPGEKFQTQINGKFFDRTNRFGSINVFKEPVVQSTEYPLELYAGIDTFSQALNEQVNRNIVLRTTFGNEIIFFANDEINRYYGTELITDANYEDLKGLYLDGGLEDAGSPLNSFKLLRYKQSVWPKAEHSFMHSTRSRTFYVNTFWRDLRLDRTESEVSNKQGTTVPFQSMWPLDAAADFETRSQPNSATGANVGFFYYIGGESGSLDQGGFNTGDDTETNSGTPNASLGGSGILQNSYAQVCRGSYPSNTAAFTSFGGQPSEALTGSCYYSRRHTLNSIESVVSPSGMYIEETGSLTEIAKANLFEGVAAWDAGRQSSKNPFYDSYESYGSDIKLKGQGYSIIPEFRISSHVETYETKGVTEELKEIFELSGALEQNTTTSGSSTFYKVLSNSDFMQHFELIKKDHKDFANPIAISLKCKAIKKFLPYEGFYPAERTVNLAEQFNNSYGSNIFTYINGVQQESSDNFAKQAIIEPLFAPGILFNTIKSGVACDYPLIFANGGMGVEERNSDGDTSGDRINFLIQSSSYNSTATDLFSTFIRIPFEAIVEPERFLSTRELQLMGSHPFELAGQDLTAQWSGDGDSLYTKMANNFLAETIDFFMKDKRITTLASLPSENPAFGNAESGSFYAMRIKMKRSRNKPNDFLPGFGSDKVIPPQDLYPRFSVKENFTMYSRPSAFGPPIDGGGDTTGSYGNSAQFTISGSDSLWGYNFPYTPPYYYGEGWCDLIFEATETRKYTIDEILSSVKEFPYYTRFWWNGTMDALRDVNGYAGSGQLNTAIGIRTGAYAGYINSPWHTLITSSVHIDSTLQCSDGSFYVGGNWGDAIPSSSFGSYPDRVTYPQTAGAKYLASHPYYLNYNAMQINSSVNLFGKGVARITRTTDSGEEQIISIDTEATSERKSRWIIQPKFETPMLNFNSYTNLTTDEDLTCPTYASESVSRGMWHQYGLVEEDPQKGVFLEIGDIPPTWWKGALGVNQGLQNAKIKSLADLCGFSKDPVKLGQVGQSREISEAVVAVPFVEREGTRQFFSLSRRDIERAKTVLKLEVEPGVFVALGPDGLNVSEGIVDMVRNMQKYVFPPSMDFVKTADLDPFAMYVFEFKHELDKQDLADMWQNLPPKIGRSFEEAEVTIAHPLLAKELLGGGSVLSEGILQKNAKGNDVPTDIQWMIFKVKRKAKTNYFDKVVTKKGETTDSSSIILENATGELGEPEGFTYNWPYDFFSLVELVKLDAEVMFSNVDPTTEDSEPRLIKKTREQERALREGKPRSTKARNSFAGLGDKKDDGSRR